MKNNYCKKIILLQFLVLVVDAYFCYSASVTITEPEQYFTTVTVPSVYFSGTATGSNITVKYSSDRDIVGSCQGTTSWSATIPLKPGKNRILIQVHESQSSIATAERIVRYIPSGQLGISNLSESATSIECWETLEITFNIENSAATHIQFPYETNLPPGLTWADGITVDGIFSPDNWATVYRRPGFLYQKYQRAYKNNREWLYPQGDPVWTIRFAPPLQGNWKYKIEIKEAKGTFLSQERSFVVTAPTNPNNHGPIRVSKTDKRYFEYADGTPFIGMGHNINIDADKYSYDASNIFNTIGTGNQQLLRWWIAGHIWSSAWQPWSSATLGNAGNSPRTGLIVTKVYGDSKASLQLNSNNPLMYQGFMSGHAGVISGKKYRVRVRWCTDNATGTGLSIRYTNNWPEISNIGSYQILVQPINGTTPWHVATGDYTATSDFVPEYICICFQGSGTGYVDECALHEVLADGSLGPQLLRSPKFCSVYTMDPRRSAGMDAIFSEAAAKNIHFKLVISERREEILNRIDANGNPYPQWDEFEMLNDNFFAGPNTMVRSLHEYYWRYMFARFGASRAIHSWELCNEASPASDKHFDLAGHLAKKASADGNPHPSTTSTWSGLAEDKWKSVISSCISHTDFHCYVRGTGWIGPEDELARDSARFFIEYDNNVKATGFGKPVVWGEMGIDTGNTDDEDPGLANDNNGVWLHKIVWARTNSGGVYPLYWYTNNIFNKNLHSKFGNWRRFMDGIPLTNGRYVDAGATATNTTIRVVGQKDIQDGRAHIWIDNKDNTWYSPSATAISCQVKVPMQVPNIRYEIKWYNTQTGQVSSTEQVNADSSGVITLNISNLTTDTACRITKLTGIPSAPSNLNAKVISKSQIDLSWTDNSQNETGFKIERKKDTSGTYTQINTIGANITSYSDIGLSSGTLYFYRVRAYSNDGDSDYSNEVSAYTFSDTGSSTQTVSAPIISPNSGTYADYVTVSMSCLTGGAIIRYTLDGSIPNTSSIIYTSPFTITETTTVKAKAFKSGMYDSAVTTATYIIQKSGNPYGILYVSTDTINIGSVAPEEMAVSSFVITNLGTGQLSATLFSDQEWIKIDPVSVTIEGVPNAIPVTVTVIVDNSILRQKEGQFRGKITIESNGGYAEITVVMTATCVLVRPNPYNPDIGNLVFFGNGIIPNKTKVTIYTLSGVLVNMLEETRGATEILWDGKNINNEKVVSGVYLYVYESSKEKGIGKFTVIRK